MTAQDVSLVQKPLTIDILMRIVTDEGQTMAQIMRSYDDLVNRTVHYRLSEMFDMGWIEYRDSVMSSKAIFATPRGQYIHEIVTDVLADIECLGGA